MAAPSSSPSLSRVRVSYLALALVSGGIALVYEVAWTRAVALLIGSQVEAISAVLVAFFGGLAVGARVLGAVADRTRSPLALYGRLEVIAGVLAGVSPWVLGGMGALLIGRVPMPVVTAAVVAYLFVITFLLGGTLPALVRGAVREPAASARAAGWLVGINTVGAVAGVAVAAVSIPAVGLMVTSGTSGVAAVLLGGVALVMARGGRGGNDALPLPGSLRSPTSARGGEVSGVVLVVAALAGVATLGFEVLAARAAALILGSSLFAWALVLGLFLLGLAAGNLVIARRAGRTSSPCTDLGVIEVLAAVFLAAGIAWCVPSYTTGASGLTRVAVIAICAWALPTTLLMGAAFPLFVRLAVRRPETVGASFGAVSFANTGGGIVGAIVGPFLLLPHLGLGGALIACAAINGALGLALLAAGAPAGMSRLVRPLAGAAVGVGLGFGAFQLVATPPPSGSRLVARFDGRQATAAVVHVAGRRDLIVDGDQEASTEGDARITEELLGTLPLIIHPEPRTFLEVGLGSGITLGTAARFPLERLDCVEISSEVISCAPFFAPDNRNIASGADERIRIVRGDGRAYLRQHPGEYDVIVANTLHPWSVGATGLYSREYFGRIRRGLRDGGIAAQWIPLHRLGTDHLSVILRTFFDAFPDGGIWWGAENLFLVGRRSADGEQVIDADAPDFAGAGERLRSLGIRDGAELARRFVATSADVTEMLGSEDVLTDDRPVLELGALRGRMSDSGTEELDLVCGLAHASGSEALSAWLASRVERVHETASGADAMEQRAIDAGLDLARRHRARRSAREGLVSLKSGVVSNAERALRRALEDDPTQREARFGLAVLAHGRGRASDAARQLERLVEDHPNHAEAWHMLAVLRSQSGDSAGAREAVDRAYAADPWAEDIIALRAELTE
ncbi:MAG: tetratricopeptide repeat protein [Planctomycetes bacterium]|nr:tetratricopeptide repeat protein [Planctomycetota bacterium]